jgi:hypothetical protein
MAVRRVLVMVEDTPSVVMSAFAMTAAPPTVPAPPPGFQVDTTFPAVPIEHAAVTQTLTAMVAGPTARVARRVGSRAYVLRGFMDDRDIDAASQATLSGGSEHRVFADPDIEGMPTCGGDPPLGTALDVQRLLGAGQLVQQKMDGRDVALVIVDTGINLAYLRSKELQPTFDTDASWSASSAIVPGNVPVNHGTMCAYDALLTAPNARLFDHAVLSGAPAGGSTMSGTLSNALQSFGKLLQLMMLPPDKRQFHSMVVSNSWGMFSRSWDFPAGNPGRYGDNPRHPFNIIVGSLAAAGADILFAAGNCGPVCPDARCDRAPNLPPIFLANSHDDVLCVAGVDTKGAVVGYSSRGPGIALGPGHPGNQKPDIAAYTHFLGSEAFGVKKPDTGTSAACPVLAGVVAALRSVYPYDPGLPSRSPANVRQFLRNTATGTGSWQSDWGYGIIDTTGFPTAGTVL